MGRLLVIGFEAAIKASCRLVSGQDVMVRTAMIRVAVAFTLFGAVLGCGGDAGAAQAEEKGTVATRGVTTSCQTSYPRATIWSMSD